MSVRESHMRARAYLRASTTEQDATRAPEQIEAFAAERGLDIVGWFIENESGATLQRPELFRLLEDSKSGDVLLVEQVDRLSRLTDADWRKLRALIDVKALRIVSLDLPTSWQLTSNGLGEFTSRMFAAINSMLLDMLAAVARKDYEDRRRRQQQGIEKAKREGLYRGRREDTARNEGIAGMLKAGMSWSSIQAATGCSRATIAKVSQRQHATSHAT
jgi:DNA invertase Pin-like site-specific DNA recombinase